MPASSSSAKRFGRSGEVLGDEVVTTALIGRVVHYAGFVAYDDSLPTQNRDLGRVHTDPANTN